MAAGNGAGILDNSVITVSEFEGRQPGQMELWFSPLRSA
jgi:hypothetical protein